MTARLRHPGHAIGRVLGLEKHEYVAVAWSFAYFFCVLSSYTMLRPVREEMGVQSGTLTLPTLFTTTFVVMMIASPLFGWIASRYRRSQFLPWVYYFFAANMLLFFVVFSWALDNEVTIVWIGRAFFVWLSVFNLFVVSVFWSFMADIYSRGQARRLFGVISAGGSLGALAGPRLSIWLVDDIGFQNLLPISAGLLLIGVLCIHKLRRWVASDTEHEHPDASERAKPLGGGALAGMAAIAKSRYLLLISAMSIIASLLGTALYMFVNKFVGDSVADSAERIQLFGRIDFWTNVFSTLFQLLLVRQAVKRIGLGATLALMPIVSVVGFALLALNPILVFAAVFQGMRRAIGFGFAKPSSDMLYSVVSREEKYKAKNFIDTAVYRIGDVIGIWSIRGIWSLGVTSISWILVPFAVLWAAIAFRLGREYRHRDAARDLKAAAAESEPSTAADSEAQKDRRD